MSGFSEEWLSRRAPFDLAARDVELAQRFTAALGKTARVVDLAAGHGANFRVLAPIIGGDQDWVLVDQDPMLLAAQAPEIARWAKREGWRCSNEAEGVTVETGTGRWRARAMRLDLARDLERLDFKAFTGVTTTAFLDLVSASWLDRLAAVLAKFHLPLLATLTVDGRRDWHPPLPEDVALRDAFLQHQAGDKGFGPALGAASTAYLEERLAALGHKTFTVKSDWRISPEHRRMLSALIEEAAAVASESDPRSTALFTNWLAERQAQLSGGLLSGTVGHLDLLSLPRETL